MISATVTGRLGNDAEVKHLQDGTAILELSIASSSTKKDAKPTWIRASMFGERGAKLAQYLKKGNRVAACGTVELREWESNGKSGTTLEMRIDQVDLIQDRAAGDDGGNYQPAASNNTRPGPSAAARARIPF